VNAPFFQSGTANKTNKKKTKKTKKQKKERQFLRKIEKKKETT
jgi:hypothetical protein